MVENISLRLYDAMRPNPEPCHSEMNFLSAQLSLQSAPMMDASETVQETSGNKKVTKLDKLANDGSLKHVLWYYEE